jgi:CheY-like chemotaxis protein
MKILIVDDESDIRRIARLALSRIGGMDVAEATGGVEAVARARAENPDVILLDVMMPDMDGPAALAALQADPQTASIPVLFLTAKAMASEIERLTALGARGVLTKPFDPMTLAAQVRKALGQE